MSALFIVQMPLSRPLLDLPVSVVEHVMRLADPEDRVRLSHCCRALDCAFLVVEGERLEVASWIVDRLARLRRLFACLGMDRPPDLLSAAEFAEKGIHKATVARIPCRTLMLDLRNLGGKAQPPSPSSADPVPEDPSEELLSTLQALLIIAGQIIPRLDDVVLIMPTNVDSSIEPYLQRLPHLRTLSLILGHIGNDPFETADQLKGPFWTEGEDFATYDMYFGYLAPLTRLRNLTLTYTDGHAVRAVADALPPNLTHLSLYNFTPPGAHEREFDHMPSEAMRTRELNACMLHDTRVFWDAAFVTPPSSCVQ